MKGNNTIIILIAIAIIYFLFVRNGKVGFNKESGFNWIISSPGISEGISGVDKKIAYSGELANIIQNQSL